MIEGLWEYHDRLPVELSAVVLKEGLTECIHDMLSAAINGLQQGKQNEWLHYNKTVQALECQIAGFEYPEEDFSFSALFGGQWSAG